MTDGDICMTDTIDLLIAEELIGNTPVMRALRELIRVVAPSAVPVLIHGPTGVGKELVARALHIASARSGAFVALNVCAVGDGMLEDALFGHVRGAFTGAVADSRGYMLEAHNGTLFLDEVGGLSLSGQAKLLRAVETKEFRPVGGRADRRSSFRLVSATNQSLTELVGSHQFREDLLYRLRGVAIAVPPLSERLEDIPLLAERFARSAATGCQRVSDAVIDTLQAQEWPGNVRELRATVECALTLGGGRTMSRSDVERALAISRTSPSLLQSGRERCADRQLLAALEEHDWDVDAAAESLGIHRSTIYRWLARIGGRSSRRSPHGGTGTASVNHRLA
jgi:two-component system NtrC family response regulator